MSEQTPRPHRTFKVVEIVLVASALIAIGLVGWLMLRGENSSVGNTPASQIDRNAPVSWSWNGSAWTASSVAPACPDPLAFPAAPTDTSKVTSILYPGQKRGGQYKPHGGFRFADGSNAVPVRAIMDGYVTSGARYIEQGEVQYLFTITNSCGIAYRLDHLADLAPALKTVADTLPAPKVDDSRTTAFEKPILLKAGDPIATAVGFKKTGNATFDLGVYDYRKRNNAASKTGYVSEHQNDLSQAAYALCWLDMFPGDAVLLQGLPAGDSTTNKTSDYCQ